MPNDSERSTNQKYPSSTEHPQAPCLDNMSKEEFDRMMEISLRQAMNGEGRPVDEAFALIRAGIL